MGLFFLTEGFDMFRPGDIVTGGRLVLSGYLAFARHWFDGQQPNRADYLSTVFMKRLRAD
jgi:hypothetical protein